MEKGYKIALAKALQDVKHYADMNAKYGNFEEELLEKQERVRDLKSLWKRNKKFSHVQSMAKLVDKYVNYYHADFFYYDLTLMEKYTGERIAWFVGDCGTHIVFLDETEFTKSRTQKDLLNAVLHSYGNYQCFMVNTKNQTVISVKPSELQFRESNAA